MLNLISARKKKQHVTMNSYRNSQVLFLDVSQFTYKYSAYNSSKNATRDLVEPDFTWKRNQKSITTC